MRPDRLGFRPVSIEAFIHSIDTRVQYKRKQEYIIYEHTKKQRPSEKQGERTREPAFISDSDKQYDWWHMCRYWLKLISPLILVRWLFESL